MGVPNLEPLKYIVWIGIMAVFMCVGLFAALGMVIAGFGMAAVIPFAVMCSFGAFVCRRFQ